MLLSMLHLSFSLLESEFFEAIEGAIFNDRMGFPFGTMRSSSTRFVGPLLPGKVDAYFCNYLPLWIRLFLLSPLCFW